MTKAFVCLFLIAIIVGGLTVFSTITGAEAQNMPFNISFPPVNTQTYGQYSMGATNYGGSQDDWAYCIKQTSDIGLILAGQTKSYGAGGSDMWLIKTGLSPYTMDNGVTGAYQREKWNMTYGGASDDGAFSVIQTSDGGFAAAGFTGSYGAGGIDMWLVKTASDGRLQWSKTYGGPDNDSASCLIQTADGGYLLSGYTNSGVQSQSAWIVKTDVSGNMKWSKTLSGTAANSVAPTLDGGYAIAVEKQDAFGFIKTDSSGDVLANQLYPTPSSQASAQAIVQADDGGYAIAGWTSNPDTGLHDTWLVKTDASGQKQWSQTYPELGGYDLIKTSKGGYALTGDRAFLIITDASGNVEWNRLYDMQTGNGSQYFTCMQSLIEASPDHFVLAGVHNGGQYVNLQFEWLQVALKSGEQLIPPETTILSPINTTYTERNIPLTFYVNEPTIRFTGYSINGLFNTTINGNVTLENLHNGSYNVTVISTDTDYNTAPSQTVSFTVNSSEPYVLPKVTIQSPICQTYNTTQLTLNFSVNQRVFWTAYSLDGSGNKTAYPNSILFIANGTHQLTVYAGDIVGGEAGSATVNFNIAVSSSSPFDGGGYGNMINEVIEAVAQITTSETFLITVAFLALVLGVVIIVVVIVTRNSSKQKKLPRIVR
jgi:hypothetical protein